MIRAGWIPARLGGWQKLRTCTGTICLSPPGSAAPTYYLTDHLGSTSLAVDATGNKISEMRYTACPLRFTAGVLRKGEVRYVYPSGYTWGSTPTRYAYTGQYSNVPEFGLMYYNARWYDPGLGRFAQADSIVPPGVQGLDRYAYVKNSPMNYTDPSGHKPVCDDTGDPSCGPEMSLEQAWRAAGAVFGIKFSGKWSTTHMAAVVMAANKVGYAFASATKMVDTAVEAFKAVYGGITFTWGSCPDCKGAGGYTYGQHDIRFVSMAQEWRSDYQLRQINNVIHELGHAFNWAMSQAPENLLNDHMNPFKPDFNSLLVRSSDPNSYSGFASRNNERVWVQNPATTASEVFADQYLGWVGNKWEQLPNNRYSVWTDAGTARANWMGSMSIVV